MNNDNFRNPLFFLFIFTLILGVDLGGLSRNLAVVDSIMVGRPILLSDNIFETVVNFFLFLIPVILIIAGLNHKNSSLKIIYLIGAAPLVLTPSLINKISFKGLYLIKIILLFIVVISLTRYLVKEHESSKSDSTNNKGGADNLSLH